MAYDPTPGQQNPGKYGNQVGPNYQKYGEQPGRIYYPPTDTYYMDPKYAKEYGQQQGYIEEDKKPPGLVETLAPVAGVLGAAELGKAAGKGLPGLFSLGGGGAGSTGTGAGVLAGETGAGLATTGGEVAAGTAAPGVTASGLLSGVAVPAAVVAGTYLGGKALYDMYKGEKPNTAGRVIAGMATGGLSEVAKATGLLGHKSTRDRQADVTDRLMEQSGNDVNAQNYVSGMRKQFESAPTDPSKPFAGKYGSWNEYEKAGLEAGDLTGVEGNIETYTPQVWANLTQEQRQAVTQKNIDSGLYYSEDGGVKIKDPATAKQNLDAVLTPAATPPPVQRPIPGSGMLNINKGPEPLR